jgi:16S rRNA (guanine527-N7)-methyltransferase
VSPEPFGPEAFAQATGVSRETLARLKSFAGLLEDWNARHNLVSARSLEDVWQRHMLDSAQLAAFIPDAAKSLVDLGSGAGFPGIVLATILREREGFRAVLYESTAKKCAFLTEVATRLSLKVDVLNARMEAAKREPFDVITARACAPLDKLLGYAQHFAGPNTVCLFLKGQNLEAELTKARKSWRMKALRHQSRSDPSGTILEVREIANVRTRSRP